MDACIAGEGISRRQGPRGTSTLGENEGNRTSKAINSRIPTSVHRFRSPNADKSHSFSSRDNRSRDTESVTAATEMPASVASRRRELKRTTTGLGMVYSPILTRRPFSLDSSLCSLSTGGGMNEIRVPPAENERLNPIMERLFEAYRRKERRGSLGSDTDASLSESLIDEVANDELGSSQQLIRRKRHVAVRRCKSSIIDRRKPFFRDSIFSAQRSIGTPTEWSTRKMDIRNTWRDVDPLCATQKHARTNDAVPSQGRVIIANERHQEPTVPQIRVTPSNDDPAELPARRGRTSAKKFVPPKATGVIFVPRSRSCGLSRQVRHEGQRETSETSIPPRTRTRSHESFRSSDTGQRFLSRMDERKETGTMNTLHEPRKSRYESFRMEGDVFRGVTQTKSNDDMESLRKSVGHKDTTKPSSYLRSSATARHSFRSNDSNNNRNSSRSNNFAESLTFQSSKQINRNQSGSASRIPLPRTFTKRQMTSRIRRPTQGLEQNSSPSGSDNELDHVSRPHLSRPKERDVDRHDPEAIVISSRSLWLVGRSSRHNREPEVKQMPLPAGLDRIVRNIMTKHVLLQRRTGRTTSSSSSSNGAYLSSSGRGGGGGVGGGQ